jgi:hypothetical protein
MAMFFAHDKGRSDLVLKLMGCSLGNAKLSFEVDSYTLVVELRAKLERCGEYSVRRARKLGE